MSRSIPKPTAMSFPSGPLARRQAPPTPPYSTCRAAPGAGEPGPACRSVGVLFVFQRFRLRGVVGVFDCEQGVGESDLRVVGGVVRVRQLVLGSLAVMQCGLVQVLDGGQMVLNVGMDLGHLMVLRSFVCTRFD